MTGKQLSRRAFLGRAAWGAAVAAAGAGRVAGAGPGRPRVPAHTLTVIAGKPRERGRRYGKECKDGIHSFLKAEILGKRREGAGRLLRFAAACGKEVKGYAPAVLEELGGVAEGAGLKLEEVLLLACHEELWQGGALPPLEHCHAVAAGPPATAGEAYVAQTYDFMGPCLSHLVRWERPEGPDVLGYGFPGLWVSVGLNSAGLALGATSVLNPLKPGLRGPRVGIPYYVWAAHVLSQESLEAALRESRRARHAGWWTAVLADDKGELANVEVRLGEVVVERGRGHIARHQFGSRKMTGTPGGRPVRLLGKVPEVAKALTAAQGKVDDDFLKKLMGRVGGAHDLLVFNATRRVAHVRRTQGSHALPWQTFRVGAK
jgi:hypothetical protein